MSDGSRSPTPSFSPPPPDHDFEASTSTAALIPPPPPAPATPSPAPDAAAAEPAEDVDRDVAMAAEPAEEAVVPAPAPPAEAADVEDDEDDADDEPAPVGETEAEKQAALERQVFGGDSGSDLSSDEEDVLRPAPTKRKSVSASRSPSRSRSPSAQPSEDDEAAGGNYSDGDDADAKEKKLKFKKSKDKQKKQKQADDGEEPAEKPRKKRKTAPAPAEEEDNDEDRPLEPMDEATQRRMALNRKIDEIIRAPKNKRKKSKRADGEDVLDEMNDDLIVNLKNKMMAAAEEDEAAVMDKKPASSKLKMLREVMSVLQQSTMSQSIVDNDLLSAVKRWLEPLPDKSLPALDIQNSFFDILVKMSIDTDTLKASGLGKIILFYSKSLRSTAHVKRQASDLLAAWSRPIIKRSSSFRTKHVPDIDIRRNRYDDEAGEGASQSQSQGGASQKKPWERQEGEKVDKKRRNVRIPAPSNTTYTHAPKYDQISSVSGGGGGAGETSQAQQKRTREMERLKKMKKLLADARTAERL